MRFEAGTPPEWVIDLLDAVSTGFRPEIPCGPLGYVWVPPQNRKQPWKVSVFPTPGEVIEAGPQDGRIAVPGFRISLIPILNVFDSAPQIDWHAPSEYTGELDGPCLQLAGRAYGEKVTLFLFEEPPDAFGPTVVFDRLKNETRLITYDPDK
jgi:hypothetical protein